MTAQQEEVEGAIAEGAEVLTLQAPLKIEADESGHVTALWTQPQIIDEIDKAGRPPAQHSLCGAAAHPGGYRYRRYRPGH